MRLSLLLSLLFPLCLPGQAKLSFQDGQLRCACGEAELALAHVYLGEHEIEPEAQPAVLGRWVSRDAAFCFVPTLPFGPGQVYTVFVDEVHLSFQLPRPAAHRQAQLQLVYPTLDTVPANLLKFYLQFSRPMSTIAYPFLALVDQAGDTLDRALLLDIPELWNEDRTLLTVWLDPGRIKRGLGRNRRLGPVLESGRYYRLVLKNGLRDSRGEPMLPATGKSFFVSEADRVFPRPTAWSVDVPKAGSGLPLLVHASEALDYGSTTVGITVRDAFGAAVPGLWRLSNGERSLAFYPKADWKSGAYSLHFAATLEDQAGNRPGRLFDAPVGSDAAETVIRRISIPTPPPPGHR